MLEPSTKKIHGHGPFSTLAQDSPGRDHRRIVTFRPRFVDDNSTTEGRIWTKRLGGNCSQEVPAPVSEGSRGKITQELRKHLPYVLIYFPLGGIFRGTVVRKDLSRTSKCLLCFCYAFVMFCIQYVHVVLCFAKNSRVFSHD